MFTLRERWKRHFLRDALMAMYTSSKCVQATCSVGSKITTPKPKINRLITSRISKSMERSRFYRDFSIDLGSECDKSVYFLSSGRYLFYYTMTRKK